MFDYSTPVFPVIGPEVVNKLEVKKMFFLLPVAAVKQEVESI